MEYEVEVCTLVSMIYPSAHELNPPLISPCNGGIGARNWTRLHTWLDMAGPEDSKHQDVIEK